MECTTERKNQWQAWSSQKKHTDTHTLARSQNNNSNKNKANIYSFHCSYLYNTVSRSLPLSRFCCDLNCNHRINPFPFFAFLSRSWPRENFSHNGIKWNFHFNEIFYKKLSPTCHYELMRGMSGSWDEWWWDERMDYHGMQPTSWLFILPSANESGKVTQMNAGKWIKEWMDGWMDDRLTDWLAGWSVWHLWVIYRRDIPTDDWLKTVANLW